MWKPGTCSIALWRLGGSCGREGETRIRFQISAEKCCFHTQDVVYCPLKDRGVVNMSLIVAKTAAVAKGTVKAGTLAGSSAFDA